MSLHLPSTNAGLPRVPLHQMRKSLLTIEFFREVDRVFADQRDRDTLTSAAMLALHQPISDSRFPPSRLAQTGYDALTTKQHPLRTALTLLRWGVSEVNILVAALLLRPVEQGTSAMTERYVPAGASDEPRGWATGSYARLLAWVGEVYGHRVSNLILWSCDSTEPEIEAESLFQSRLIWAAELFDHGMAVAEVTVDRDRMNYLEVTMARARIAAYDYQPVLALVERIRLARVDQGGEFETVSDTSFVAVTDGLDHMLARLTAAAAEYGIVLV